MAEEIRINAQGQLASGGRFQELGEELATYLESVRERLGTAHFPWADEAGSVSAMLYAEARDHLHQLGTALAETFADVGSKQVAMGRNNANAELANAEPASAALAGMERVPGAGKSGERI